MSALRPMRWWDVEQVQALERELFPEDAWSAEMFWSELAQTDTRHYLVAADPAGRLVGYAGLLVSNGDGDGDVQTIGVRRSSWGRGVGSALLAALLDEAVRRGCDAVLLEVRVGNERAQELYRRFGFEPVGLRRGYYQPLGVDALVMRLPLAGRPPVHHD